MALKYDEIGYWSEVKLEIIEQYAQSYSLAFSKKYSYLSHTYIDAFAGPGKHISKTSHGTVRGSPQIALDIKPPFKEYYFIDIDGDKVSELRKITSGHPEAHVLQGDCNERLLSDVFPNVQYKDFKRLFVY
jgi:three-Cys-motif partner protein